MINDKISDRYIDKRSLNAQSLSGATSSRLSCQPRKSCVGALLLEACVVVACDCQRDTEHSHVHEHVIDLCHQVRPQLLRFIVLELEYQLQVQEKFEMSALYNLLTRGQCCACLLLAIDRWDIVQSERPWTKHACTHLGLCQAGLVCLSA